MYEPLSKNSTENTDSIASSSNNNRDDFFAQQKARKQMRQDALDKLRYYADLANKPVAEQSYGTMSFLKPIEEIITALRCYLKLPALPVGTPLTEQVVIHPVGKSDTISGFEDIDFTGRLQKAIAEVEALPQLTASRYQALYYQYLHLLYTNCERVVNANFWPIHPLAETVRWLNDEANNGAAPTMPLLTSLAYTLAGYYLDAPAASKHIAKIGILACYGQLTYPLQLKVLSLMVTPTFNQWLKERYFTRSTTDLLSAFQWLKERYFNRSITDLLSALRQYRNKDGSDAQQVMDYIAWLKYAGGLLADTLVKDESQRRTDHIQLILRDMRSIDDLTPTHAAGVIEYRIKPELYEQLFEKNSQQQYKFKTREYPLGRHTVYPIYLTQDNASRPQLWIKLLPEQPGIEFAIYRLAERLGLKGVIPGLIGNIRLNGKDKGQAVWISADAGWQSEWPEEIKTLAEVVENEPELLNKIDSASLTRAILRVLLSNPEDDKGNDYFLIPCMKDDDLFYHIARIDNERGFFAVEKQETIGLLFSQTVLQVKSSLFCLAQMQQPLDEEVLKEFAALDMYQVLKAWIDELQLEHKRYKELFTEPEIRAHFPKDKPDITILAVMLHEKLMPELLGRLQLIQHTIRSVVDRQEELTGLALLRHVQPTLVSKGQDTYHYAKAFTEYPAPHQAKDRFEQLTKGQYSTASSQVHQMSLKSAALSAQQSLRLERSLTVADVLESRKDELFSPLKAKQQLEQLANTNASAIWQDLLASDSKFQTKALAAFSELPIKQRATLIEQATKVLTKNPKAYDLVQQEIILRAIATANWQSLTLSAFANVLTPQLFQLVIKQTASSLVHLDISSCSQLKENEIALIVNQCYLLESLNISDLKIEQLTIDQPLMTSWLLPRLTLLIARRCQNLQSINLQLTALMRLEAENCTQLIVLKAEVHALARAMLTGCEQLPHRVLKSVLPLTSIGNDKNLNDLWENIPEAIKAALECYARGEEVDRIDEEIKLFSPKLSKLDDAQLIIFLQLSIRQPRINGYQISTRSVNYLWQELVRQLDYRKQSVFQVFPAILYDYALSIYDALAVYNPYPGNDQLSLVGAYDTSFYNLFFGDIISQIQKRKGTIPAIHERLYLRRKSNFDWLSGQLEQMERRVLILKNNIPMQILLSISALLIIRQLFLYNQPNAKAITAESLKQQRLEANSRLSTAQPDNNLTVPPVNKLPALNDQLVSWNLTHKDVDDRELEQFLEVCNTYTQMALKEVTFAKNRITNKGLQQLSQQLMPKLPYLTHLNLADNDFDEFGLDGLMNALAMHNPLLQHLDISANPIGDNGMYILAEYLMTNNSLQSLSIRNTHFSESIGYPRLLACFKRNFTLVKVDITDNLLISSASQTELTQLLKRNQDLQPAILILQKTKTDYLDTLKWSVMEVSRLLNQKRVCDLNTIDTILEQLRSLWKEIEGSYNTIRHVITAEGNDESHPLLASLSEAQEHHSALEERYQEHKAQLPADAWQRNRVTIRIWMTELSKIRVGHVAVATPNSYLSFWPAEAATRWQVITGSGIKATFHRLIDDEKAEGPDWDDTSIKWPAKRRRVADKIIVLYSLDSMAIEKKIQELFEEGNQYSLMNKSKAKFGAEHETDEYKQLGNCCDKACEVIQAQIQRLTGELLERQFGMATPDAILKWVEAAKQKEISRYGRHTMNFKTLRSEEEPAAEKVYPANFVQQPLPEARRSYVERGLFFGFKRTANEKLGSELQQWSETANPTYIATVDYDTTHDEEVGLKAGDLIEDLTPVLDTPDFKQHLPHDMWPQDGTKNPNLPGWIHFKSVRSAKVRLRHNIPGTSLHEGMELKLIGKKGSLQDDDCVIICQHDTPEASKKYSLHRRNAAL